MDALIIVESPAKARTIARYLGQGHAVKASVGHVKDLPPKRLGVDVEKDFEPEYVVIRGKKKVLDEIRSAAKKADRVLLAPDPDREGEAIAWHIAEELSKVNEHVYRVLFNEITKTAIQAAIAEPQELDRNKYDSQQARRILDRLVGYEISPLLWRKVRQGLSAGRVQSVAVRLVVDREDEIRAFEPVEFWVIQALLEAGEPPVLTTRLHAIDGDKARVPDGEAAARIVADLEAGEYRVARLEKKARSRRPAPPFTTSKMQQEAARKLRFTAKRTMRVAQKLYEGLDVGEEDPVGLITYMRTDSTRVSETALTAVREHIAEKYGADYLPEKPVRYAAKKGAQDAHEAIRPTSLERTPEALKRMLGRDELKLYTLIWKRFVASQMKPARYDQTTIDVSCGRYTLRATGSVPTFPGFTAVYTEGKDENGEDEDKEKKLPRVAEGDALKLEQVLSEQKFTQPPPRFLESSLVKELEEKGIGRPSTYAAILSTIQDKGYVEKRENRFHPTELGELVTELLVENFPLILDAKFTAGMEDRLDRIQEGEVDWLDMIREFYGPFHASVENAREHMRNVKREAEPTDVICDQCGKNMVLRWGKAGRFLACSGYPECRNTREVERGENGEVIARPPETTDEVCDKCGAPMTIKRGRFGRFLACTAYPECRNTRPVASKHPCPVQGCEGMLVERRTRRGRTFWGCSRYPDCDFATWETPVEEACPQCQGRYLLTRKSRGKQLKRCPACGWGDAPPKRRAKKKKDEDKQGTD